MATSVSSLQPQETTLPYTRAAARAAAERILAKSRQPTERLSATPYDGILLDQTGARSRWYPENINRCHLIDVALCDPGFGIYALLNQAIGDIPAGQHVVVTPWYTCRQNAEYLRGECLGEQLLGALSPDPLASHLARISSVLRLEERAPNDARSGYSTIRHGVQVRFDEKTAQAAMEYFILDESTLPEQPVSMSLGAGCELIYAFSTNPAELLRAIAVDNAWSAHMAMRELGRWLKSLKGSKQSNQPTS